MVVIFFFCLHQYKHLQFRIQPPGSPAAPALAGGSVVDNLLANAGAARDAGSIPGLGRSPEGGNGNPLQYFLPEKSNGQKSLAGYICALSQTFHHFLYSIGLSQKFKLRVCILNKLSFRKNLSGALNCSFFPYRFVTSVPESWLYRSHEDMFKVLSFCYRYEMPQYGSRRRLLPPAGQEEYGEVVGEAEEEYEEEEVTTIIFYVMLLSPTPRDLPNPGIKPESLASPALAGRFFTTTANEKAKKVKPKVEIREPSEEEEVVVTIEKPPPAEPTYTTWKRARIFPMIFKKVRGLADRRGIIDLEEEERQRRLEEEDKDYLKLTLDQDEATESTVESEEESSSDYTEYSEEESEFSESETTEEESESATPSEEEESSTPESEESESTESEGEKARKNIFLARRRPVVEEVKEVKGRKGEPAEEPEELQVEEEEERPAEEQKSELAPVEEPTDLESRDVTEEGSAESASVEGGVESEEESESSSVSSSSESQSGGPWGFQVPAYDPSKYASQKSPGAHSEGYNTAL
ncbi:hypothetical protein FD755_006654 [Muntiacus reevesi]|uniref:Uncharacterized protein n=1 Tax=Muntiacus reevesi TaxID=9886 RepID=A0A5J5MY34_MUNRE|nr:hypothetical protein FD755_006654 [Muntiacus reevesi]